MAPGHLSQNHSVFKILLLLQKNQLDFDSELLRSPFKFIPYSEVSRKLESAAELFRMEASRLPYGPQYDEGMAKRPALRLFPPPAGGFPVMPRHGGAGRQLHP